MTTKTKKAVEETLYRDFIHNIHENLWVSSPEFAGWLSKRTSNWLLSSSFFGSRAWANKWVCLHGTELLYMDREPLMHNLMVQDDDEEEEAGLRIRRAQVNADTLILPDEEGHERGFNVSFNPDGGPVWHFRAESLEEKANWMIKLSQVLAIVRWLEDYERVKILGVGGQGIVYELVHKTTGEVCALKEMEIKSEKQMANAIAEAQFLKQIVETVSHPNIMQIQKVFQVGSKFFLVFPLCQGGELYDAVVRRGNLTEFDAARITQQLVSALHVLHENDILHLDIKPENILFETTDDDSKILLTDFGLARLFSDVEKDQKNKKIVDLFNDPANAELSYDEIVEKQCQQFINSGEFGSQCLRGTYGYMSPELILCGTYSKASDVFAAGVVLYILLVGYPPFFSKSNRQTFLRTVRGLYKNEGADWDEVSPEAKDLVKRMLEKDPRKRITTTEILQHPWILSVNEPPVSEEESEAVDNAAVDAVAQSVQDKLDITGAAAPTLPAVPPVLTPPSFSSKTSNIRQLSMQMRRNSLQGSVSHLASHLQVMQRTKIAATVTKIMSLANDGSAAHHSRLAALFLKTALPKEYLELSDPHPSEQAVRNSESALPNESDSGSERLQAQDLFLLVSKETKTALLNAIVKKFGSDGKLSYEQVLQFRRYFGFQGFHNSSPSDLSQSLNTAGNNNNNNTSSSTAALIGDVNSYVNLGDLLLLRMIDRDNDGAVSVSDVLTLQILLMQKHEQILHAIFRIYVEAIWYPGKHLNMMHAMQITSAAAAAAAVNPNESSASKDRTTAPMYSVEDKLNVIEPPKYITAKNVSAIFEKFGQSPEDGAQVFNMLCNALQKIKYGQRDSGDLFEDDGTSDIARIPSVIAEDETEEGEMDGEELEKSIIESAATGENKSLTSVSSFTLKSNSSILSSPAPLSESSGMSESMFERIRKRSQQFKALRKQRMQFSSAQSTKRRMDVNDFVRVARIDDILVQVIFRNSTETMYSFIRYCERTAQIDWLAAHQRGETPPSALDMESSFLAQLDNFSDGFRPQSLPPLPIT